MPLRGMAHAPSPRLNMAFPASANIKQADGRYTILHHYGVTCCRITTSPYRFVAFGIMLVCGGGRGWTVRRMPVFVAGFRWRGATTCGCCCKFANCGSDRRISAQNGMDACAITISSCNTYTMYC